MNVRITILLILGMSLSFSIILGIFVVSRHQPPAGHRLPVLRAPTAAAIAASKRKQADRSLAYTHKAINTNSKSPNKLDIIKSNDFKYEDTRDWIEQLEPKGIPVANFQVPSKHLDRIQAALMERVEALKESRDLMLKELADQLQNMDPVQVAAELRILDDETAAIALAKLTKAKRKAVLKRMDADRATTLGRMATNYASKNRKG